MITPKWLATRIQPIAIRDVLRYLVGCATLPSEMCRAFDIGGPEVLTYEQMMQRYAAVHGLPRRIVVKTPFLSPSLSSHWVGLVTPFGLDRPPARRVAAQRGRGVRSRHRAVDSRSARGAARLRRGRSTGADTHPRRRRNALVIGVGGRCPERSATDRPGLGRWQPARRRALQRRRRGKQTLACHQGHRRRERLVLLAARLAGTRDRRPVAGRPGASPWPAQSARPADRRRRRLVAGRGDR